ncbi:MAG TPA: outer membrane protein assembly factor BamD [Terriglobia bacterium]|nr:outer membrane protein assembly factor BamD [Terriglobia bacterium]
MIHKTILIAFLVVAGLSSACGGRKTASSAPVQKAEKAEKREKAEKPELNEPDRTLYERAQHEMKRGRYDIARLSLQTLINTYPDSEYLPRAKYGLGEASYREGGREKLDRAAAEFEDYITFFPTTDDADDAQMMIALTHYKQMLAPDRDQTQARFALYELDKMIRDYPDSPLLEEAKTRRRNVQELLAEGDFRIGKQYMVQGQFQAAVKRLQGIVDTYPDYSRLDETLFLIGEIYLRAQKLAAVQAPELAEGVCPCVTSYERVVRDFPRSAKAEEAKKRLTAMNLPIPDPNPAALEREEIKLPERGIFGKMVGAVLDRGPADANKTGATSVTVDDNRKPGGEGLITVSPGVNRP